MLQPDSLFVGPFKTGFSFPEDDDPVREAEYASDISEVVLNLNVESVIG
jgi:hypothetical protein